MMAPGFCGHHAARGFLRPEKHRVEIGRQHAPPFFRRHLDRALELRHAGIVDEDSDGAEGLLRLVEGADIVFAIKTSASMRDDLGGLIPVRPWPSRSARRATSATAAPLSASTSGELLAEPARRAGHQRDAAGQVEHLGGFSSASLDSFTQSLWIPDSGQPDDEASLSIKPCGSAVASPGTNHSTTSAQKLDQHERDDADIDVPGGDLRRRHAAQEEQRRAERRVHVGGLQVHRHHDAEPDRIDAWHRQQVGATIGTTTKMISKASMTKPSRNIATITASIAPAAPPGRSVSARWTRSSPPSRGTPG